MRAWLSVGFVLVTLLTPVRAALAEAAPKGDAEHRAGWKAFAAPAADPEKSRSLDARQEARMAAIPHMDAAAAADPKNAVYLTSLTYVCLAAGQYEAAQAAIEKAIAIRRDDPLLYLLRGQAEAALAQMNPPEAGSLIGDAMGAFDRAAELDPSNSLPLLQAASVAFDVGRADLATPRLQKALKRPGCTLYRLTVPADLEAEKTASMRSWQYAQLGHWLALVARFRNVSRFCVKLGAEEEGKGNLEAAEERYAWALEVGRQVGAADPNLFITVASAAGMMEDAYGHLARVEAESVIRREFAAECSGQEWLGFLEGGKALVEREVARAGLSESQRQETYAKSSGMNPPPANLDDQRWTPELLVMLYARLRAEAERPLEEVPQVERWLGERGVVSFARQQLAAALQTYLKKLSETPPEVEQVLALEETMVAPVIAGMGLQPKRPFRRESDGAGGSTLGSPGKARSAVMQGPMPARTG